MTDEALEFLRALGLTEPDPVDDVIWNVLPRYRTAEVLVSDEQYAADIERMLAAYQTDSERRRKELVEALARSEFVRVVDAGTKGVRMSRPAEVYIATDRLQALFEGCRGVSFVDRSLECLQGEDVRALLEACGALRYLRPVESSSMSWDERRELREKAGHAESSGYNDRVSDWNLHGLEPLLDLFQTLPTETLKERARMLWEELAHLEERRGKSVFTAEYSWSHYGRYKTECDAAFIRLLNRKPWIPDSEGCLRPPSNVLFESLGWRAHPFLQSKLRFKPPIIDQLAAEAGIEPGVLDLLKRLGLTTESELRARLKLEDSPKRTGSPATDQPVEGQREGNAQSVDEEATLPKTNRPRQSDGGAVGGQNGGVDAPAEQGRSTGTRSSGNGPKTGPSDKHARGAEAPGAPPFVSYVGVDPGLKSDDNGGSSAEHRREVEESAIRFVLDLEKNLIPMPSGNPGFDLYERGDNDEPKRWVEAKAISGPWKGREVVLTHSEFECAREHRADYWLYVIEYATDPEHRRLFRIKDPAGRARNFKFDHGWADIAE